LVGSSILSPGTILFTKKLVFHAGFSRPRFPQLPQSSGSATGTKVGTVRSPDVHGARSLANAGSRTERVIADPHSTRSEEAKPRTLVALSLNRALAANLCDIAGIPSVGKPK
jgi:hypothetical protein